MSCCNKDNNSSSSSNYININTYYNCLLICSSIDTSFAVKHIVYWMQHIGNIKASNTSSSWAQLSIMTAGSAIKKKLLHNCCQFTSIYSIGYWFERSNKSLPLYCLPFKLLNLWVDLFLFSHIQLVSAMRFVP